jgi:uncharacterized CHY-type Zn-finger protein
MKINVQGSILDEKTRCEHYNSALDIIAIKFKCCNTYYACIHCHEQATNHQPIVWSKNERNTKAILCGQCSYEMSIDGYFNCNNECPQCKHSFNPKCSNHHHYYFEV